MSSIIQILRVAVLLVWIGVTVASPLDAQESRGPIDESAKIEKLIESIEQSKAIFIRNGKEHTSDEASAHLRRKLKSARNSWFAPPESQWTAQLFIEKIASKSSFTGKPYQIRSRAGITTNADVWLSDRLKEIERVAK